MAARARAARAGQRTYVRREPGDTVLHRVMRNHLQSFFAEMRCRDGGSVLPEFVRRELLRFTTCGVLAHGFARFRCPGCRTERLVA